MVQGVEQSGKVMSKTSKSVAERFCPAPALLQCEGIRPADQVLMTAGIGTRLLRRPWFKLGISGWMMGFVRVSARVDEMMRERKRFDWRKETMIAIQ